MKSMISATSGTPHGAPKQLIKTILEVTGAVEQLPIDGPQRVDGVTPEAASLKSDQVQSMQPAMIVGHAKRDDVANQRRPAADESIAAYAAKLVNG